MRRCDFVPLKPQAAKARRMRPRAVRDRTRTTWKLAGLVAAAFQWRADQVARAAAEPEAAAKNAASVSRTCRPKNARQCGRVSAAVRAVVECARHRKPHQFAPYISSNRPPRVQN